MEETKNVGATEVIDADALMAEFDRESNVRHFTGKKKIVIRSLMVAFALYAIITSIFGKYLLMLDNKIIGFGTYVMNISKRWVVQVLLPNKLRGWVFKKFARKTVK